MKLALHIGTPRTDAAAFQAWCSSNRDGLMAQGVGYAIAPGAKNHRKLVAYASETDKPHASLVGLGVTNPKQHEQFRKDLDAAMRKEIKDNPGVKTWVMSSEDIFTAVNTVGMVRRLYELLTPLFNDVTVYLHLRPQLDLVMALASQQARAGKVVTRAELTRKSISSTDSFYNYDRGIAPWEEVFGAQNLRLVPFRLYPSLTEFLIEELHINGKSLSAFEARVPELDWRAIALSNSVKRGLEALAIQDVPDLFLGSMPGDEGLKLGRALAEEVQGRFIQGNRALADRRSDITIEDLTPDWSGYSDDGNAHLMEAPCLFSEQMGYMVRRFTQEIALETWRRHVAEAKAAALAGDTKARDTAKLEAERALKRLAALGVTAPAGGKSS
ncbi:hypothetical protein LXM94_00630 [Rhizobium sp. TRM95111]|uniref:hypothetical protein n=1 Tax=Rhizobium alarense TaxID=2846851 RepID=UPI001F3EF4A9|nr:hypothetical protein [Rhizobium alarense]MCF3638472.1 hypothetical protein [Rhizobium alarense]